MKQLKRLLLLS